MEQRLAPGEEMVDEMLSSCEPPAGVTNPGMNVPYDVEQGGAGGSAPIVQHEDFAAAFQLQGELMAGAPMRSAALGRMVFAARAATLACRHVQREGDSVNFTQVAGTSPQSLFHKTGDKCGCTRTTASRTSRGAAVFRRPEYLEANGKSVLDNSSLIGTTTAAAATAPATPEGVFHATPEATALAGLLDKATNQRSYETAMKTLRDPPGMGTGRQPRSVHANRFGIEGHQRRGDYWRCISRGAAHVAHIFSDWQN